MVVVLVDIYFMSVDVIASINKETAFLPFSTTLGVFKNRKECV